MSKFTFTNEEGPEHISGYGTNTETTVSFETVQLDDVLNHFELFLRGCGFVFHGTVEIVAPPESYKDIDMDGRC